MKKRLAAMGVAATAWAGYLALTIAGFAGDMDQVWWGRVASGLLGVAVVSSIAWMQVTFAVLPRTAYRLGFESGERHQRRKDEAHQLLVLPVAKAATRNLSRGG